MKRSAIWRPPRRIAGSWAYISSFDDALENNPSTPLSTTRSCFMARTTSVHAKIVATIVPNVPAYLRLPANFFSVASVLSRAGRMEDALSAHQLALNIARENGCIGHLHTARHLEGLAELAAVGAYEADEVALKRQAMEIYVAALGPESKPASRLGGSDVRARL